MQRALLFALIFLAVLPLAACGPAPAGSGEQTPVRPEAGAATPAPGTRLTAQEAFRLVRPVAQEWQPGFKIALASPDGDDFDYDGRSSRWRFVLASASEEHFAVFRVDTAKSDPVSGGAGASRPAVTAMVDPPSWKVDSPAVWEIADANGLKEWRAAHPEFDFTIYTFELRASQEEGPYWLVVAHSSQDTIEFRISAVDGEVFHARSH